MLPKPDYERDGIRLYCADCMDILPLIGDGEVDAVVTDPPYGMNNNPDTSRFSGGQSPKIVRSGSDYRPPFTEPIIGDDRPFDPSPLIVLDVPTIIWGYQHFAHAVPAGSVLVWIKKDDHLFGTFLSDADMAWQRGGCGVYCFKKNWNGFARLGPRCAVGEVFHPNEKPVCLMAWCINRLPCGMVFDPFMGSGTTAVACIKLGRRCIGIERERKYFDIAVRRVEQAFEEEALIRGVPVLKQEQLELAI